MDPLPLLPTLGVGSSASPGWFVSGQRRVREGDFGAGDIEEMYEDATRIAIADQIEAGLDVIGDGELHRQRFVFEMFQHLRGLERIAPDRKLGVPGYDMAPRFAPKGMLEAPQGLGIAGEFRTLRRLAPNRRLKVALPGPLTFAGFMQVPDARADDVLDRLVGIVRRELEVLVDAGADYVQLDEPGLPERPFGLSFEACAALANRTVEGLAVRRAVHVCFGNNAGRPMASRDIARLMPALEALDVEELSIEFANREMAQVELLAPLSRRFDIAAGVIDVKNFHRESAPEVATRIERCLEHVAPEKLRITTDCSFSALPRGLALIKMRAMVEGAKLARERLAVAR